MELFDGCLRHGSVKKDEHTIKIQKFAEREKEKLLKL